MGPSGEQGPQGESGRTGPAGLSGSDGKDGAVYYLADFSNSSDYATWSYPGGGAHRIQNGKLLVRGGVEGVTQNAVSSLTFTGDIEALVASEWLSGVNDHSYGLVVHWQQGGYAFGISSNSGYLLGRWDASVANDGILTPIKLVDWKTSSHIVQGGYNLLRMSVTGDLLSCYINGTLVEQVRDTTHRQGTVGVFVDGNQEISFDDLYVQPMTTSTLR
jgi:hypothetical protein